MATYNGHASWDHWNVSLFINNTEDLYFYALDKVRMIGATEAAKEMMQQELKGKKTPDGAAYTFKTVYAAIKDIEDVEQC